MRSEATTGVSADSPRAIGRVTRNYYNDAGQLTSTTANFTTTPSVDPNLYNLITRYGYDPVGNRIIMTDALTHTTIYIYDLLLRLIAVSDPMTHTV
jgi:hypothetical protein